jgi:methylmalonyl-CoA mutase N-terminal domain/subunit
LAAAQISALARLRAARDEDRLRGALAGLRESARGSGNLLPPILDAVKARATLGEIADVFREIFGEYRPV